MLVSSEDDTETVRSGDLIGSPSKNGIQIEFDASSNSDMIHVGDDEETLVEGEEVIAVDSEHEARTGEEAALAAASKAAVVCGSSLCLE